MDIYLANLRRLAVPFGGATTHILKCAFMAGLPDNFSLLLWASLRLDKLGIDKLLTRAWNILKETELVAAPVRTTETLSERQHAAGDSTVPRPWESTKCYRCGGLNHYSRDCQSWGNTEGANDWKTLERLCCYCSNGLGHIAWNYSGNGSGDRVLSLALPPSGQWMQLYP